MKPHAERASEVLQTTERWLQRAVIGLNLCPFAKAVHVKGQIHYVLTWSQDPTDVLDDLAAAIRDLLAHDSAQRDTTLLIAPHAFPDFWDFHKLSLCSGKGNASMSARKPIMRPGFCALRPWPCTKATTPVLPMPV